MTDTKLREKGTGTTEWRRGHLYVKVSLPDKTRPRYRLCKDGACTCKTMSDAMRDDRAKAISERERARVQTEIAQRAALATKRLTVKELGEAWTKGELLEKHGEVNKLKDKASSDMDGYRLALAYTVPIGARTFGDIPADEVNEQIAERVMAVAPRLAKVELKRDWRPATKLQLYQALHRLFELAAVPCRLRPRNANPFVKELRPSVPQGDLVFQWLYPDEVLALLRCDASKIPLVRRVLYMVAVYTGQRKDSLRALLWRNVDFAHGVLTSPKQKNGVPLTFDLSDDVVALLAAYREAAGNPKGDRPIFNKLGCRWSRLPEQLRADLKVAGVDRASLQGDEEHEEALRFHDLRATLVVWGLKDSTKGYGWVTDRTGHLTPRMLQRYDRAARNWKEARFVPFPDLSRSFPDLSPRVSPAHLRTVG